MISTSRILLSGIQIQSNLQDISDENRIVLFQKINYEQQVEVCYWLLKCFEKNYLELGIKNIDEIYNQIMKYFTGGNSLYVYIGYDQHIWGCIGLDYDYQEPIISNFLVIPQLRGIGIAQKLLRFAENEAKSSKLDYVKLWCNECLISYYEKEGYSNKELIQQPKTFRVQTKNTSTDDVETRILKERDLDNYLDNLSAEILTIEQLEQEQLYTLTKSLK